MRTRTLATAIAVTSACLAAGALAPVAVAAPADGKSAPAAKAPAANPMDYNGDGYRDLVVNLPGNTDAAAGSAYAGGSVMVLYGSPQGVDTTKRKLIRTSTEGIPGTPEGHDRFGHRTASGDFDKDGFTDLAVSTVGEDLTVNGTYRRNAGQNTIIWGGKNGLAKHGAATVQQSAPTSIDVRRGMALAAGDFNGDGAADLAAGDYSNGRGGDVLYGPFTRKGKPKSIASLGMKDGQTYVHPGLTAGDVTGDGISDLVLQVYPGRAGVHQRIELLRGTSKGLVKAGTLKDAAGKDLVSLGADDRQLGIGDLDKDGYGDIVLGDWRADHGDIPFAGRFTVVYGGKNGQATDRKPQVFTQDTEGVPGTVERDDYFGSSISVGDINGDGYADVAAGSPVETVGDKSLAGRVTTLFGGPAGLTGQGAQVHDLDTAGVPGDMAASDLFGRVVKLIDMNRDGRSELVAGAPGEYPAVGRYSVLPGTTQGLTGQGSKTFGPADLGLRAVPETGFGETLGN
ncbi:FG-GAP and VCBS repeat-containing protein [Streptomyces sp. NPDC005953]|uniref:FG-GAP and VCBS repeat-containing protein n=1 Tax=Streptomyces sp. NPDC005953 TaxID=3156719 RepID=UPI0033D513BD